MSAAVRFPRTPFASFVSVVAVFAFVTPPALPAQQCGVSDYPTDTFQGGFTQGWGKHFGQSVDIDRTVAVVGGAGHAMVYELRDNSWVAVQNLLPPDNLVSSFGFSVAVSGTTIAVGDPGLDGGSGSVWMFDRTGGAWVRGQRLTPSTSSYPPRPRAQFGIAIDLAGDRLLVGAPGYDDGTTTIGYAFLFDRSGGNWAEKAQLTPSTSHLTRARQSGFGRSVAIDGDLAAIGMPFDVAPGPSLEDPERPDAGRVSIHEADQGWRGTTTIAAPRPASDMSYGWSVAVSGVDVVVGAPFASFPSLGFGAPVAGRTPYLSGAAFVYERMSPGTLKLTATLRPDELCTAGYTSGFGWDVDIAGDLIAVGAPTSGFDSEGEAVYYERTSNRWIEQSVLSKHPRRQGRTDRVGTAVAVTPDWAIAGAPRADRAIGEALMFDVP